jgi:hypothetical protein
MKRWTPSEMEDWDRLSIESKMSTTKGYLNPPTDWALLFTVQVFIISNMGAKFAFSLLNPNIHSSAVVIIDGKNK